MHMPIQAGESHMQFGGNNNVSTYTLAPQTILETAWRLGSLRLSIHVLIRDLTSRSRLRIIEYQMHMLLNSGE